MTPNTNEIGRRIAEICHHLKSHSQIVECADEIARMLSEYPEDLQILQSLAAEVQPEKHKGKWYIGHKQLATSQAFPKQPTENQIIAAFATSFAFVSHREKQKIVLAAIQQAASEIVGHNYPHAQQKDLATSIKEGIEGWLYFNTTWQDLDVTPLTPVSFTVPRREAGRTEVASVSASVTDPESFLPKLQEALTKWAKETPDGHEAWETSYHDFNVGDLSAWTDCESLKPYLAAAGIHNLQIDIGSSMSDGNWHYDTVLVHA